MPRKYLRMSEITWCVKGALAVVFGNVDLPYWISEVEHFSSTYGLTVTDLYKI